MQFEDYKKAFRIAKDLKKTRDSPVKLNFFAKEAWHEGFGRSVESMYHLYRHSIKKQYEDPIAPRGRPSKKPMLWSCMHLRRLPLPTPTMAKFFYRRALLLLLTIQSCAEE
jgi:hypothetical protein